MAAEAIVGLALIASGRSWESLTVSEYEQAMVAGLLAHEAICHARAISKAEVRAIFVETGGGHG